MTDTSKPAKSLANPLLQYSRMNRNKGMTEVPHTVPTQRPQNQQIGAIPGVMMLNGVEIIFQETPQGTTLRGANCMECFYYLRQDSTSTKRWSYVAGSWNDPVVDGVEVDDPEAANTADFALTFRQKPKPAIVSFYDAPGFKFPPGMLPGSKFHHECTKACMVMCFETWWVVRPPFAKGVFQASSPVRWTSVLCAARSAKDSTDWKLVSTATLQGFLETTRPVCD